MYHKKLGLVLSLCSMIGLSACAFNPEKTIDIIKDEIESTSETEADSGTDEEGIELSEEECQKFTEYFENPDNNGFLRCTYDCPENIDWHEVLRQTSIINGVDWETDEERAFAYENEGVSCWELEEFSVFGFSTTDMDNFIREHTGIGYDDCNNKILWTYVKEYDKYYYQQSDSSVLPFECVSGKKIDNVYKLKFIEKEMFDSGMLEYAPTCLTLKEENGKYLIVSNEYLWDESYNLVSTFEADLKQFDGKCEIKTYSKKDDGKCDTVITDDAGVVKGKFFSKENMKIIDLDAFDYDADGCSEIVVLEETDAGEQIMLYKGMCGDYYIETDDFFDENPGLFDVKSGVGGAKEKLLANNIDGKFDTYNKAYSQVAYLNNLLSEDGYKYDLIYVDEDDIPELVVEKDGKIQLYTYKDGKVCNLGLDNDFDSVEYSQRHNAVRSGSSENASFGCIEDCYEDYRIIFEYYYSDETGEYEVDKGKTYRAYVDDGDLTQEGVEKNARELKALEYEPISGKMTYQELKDEFE